MDMFGGKDMSKMMKQMGMDMDELDAEKVEVHLSNGKKLVFSKPELSKIDVQGQELFQLQGSYTEKEDVSDEDVELVMEKVDCSKEEAKEALKSSDDVAGAIMELQ